MSRQAIVAKLDLLWRMFDTMQDLVQQIEVMLIDDEMGAQKRAKARSKAGKKTPKTVKGT